MFELDELKWIFLATLSPIIAMIFIKQYNLNYNFMYIILAAILYIILIVSYIKILKKIDIAIIYTLIQLFQVIAVVTFGIVFFGERINTKQIFGVLLALIATYLLT